jgi:hypothetical protein
VAARSCSAAVRPLTRAGRRGLTILSHGWGDACPAAAGVFRIGPR